MLFNLNVPYSPKLHSAREAVFFSRDTENLLFHSNQIEIECVTLTHAVCVTWSLCRNMFKKPFRTGEASAVFGEGWRISFHTEGFYPGFYDLYICADKGDGSYTNERCTFGYKVEDMPFCPNRPSDFSAFWRKRLDILSGIELRAEAGDSIVFRGKQIDAYNTLYAGLPNDYDWDGHMTEEVESCKVSFESIGGIRIHAYLARPAGKYAKSREKFPAMLVLPGAGNTSRPMPLEHARHGYIAMDIQVHGLDVDLESYPSTAADYSIMYPHTVQSLNYLCSLDDVDSENIVVAGGSQGGQLSLVCAALDKRVKAVVAGVTHYSNMPYVNQALESNGDGMEWETFGGCAQAAYYDVMNFVQDISCPVLMNAGLIDKISPPAGVYTVYKGLKTGDKEIIPLPSMGHDWTSVFDIYAWKWLSKHLAIEDL